MHRLVALAVLALAGACYSPSYRDCQLECANGTCPAGLQCTAGVCRPPGMTGPCTVDPTIDAPNTDGPPGITIDLFYHSIIASLCDFDARCGVFETEAACNQLFGNIATVDSASVVGAVNAGKTVYHPERASACLAARDQLMCERDNARIAGASLLPCNTLFSGTVADGGACAINEECISQICNTSCSPGACCSGTCVGNVEPGLRNAGEACTRNDICVDSYCDGSGRCANFLADDTPCFTGTECAIGSHCTTVGTGTVCRPYADTGAGCTTSQDCAKTAAVCRGGICTTGGLTSDPCAGNGECQELHYCKDSASGCQLPPGLNQPCAGFGLCSAGYCDPASMICTPKVQDGQPCSTTVSNQCMSNYCDTSMPNPKCGTRPACF